MPETIKTTGSTGVDREFDTLNKQIRDILARLSALEGAQIANPKIPAYVPPTSYITVSDDTTEVYAAGLIFDSSDGVTVSQFADRAKIDISAGALADAPPPSVGTTNTLGTSDQASREDHTHQGVHSLSKSGSAGLVGDVTLTGSGAVSLTQAGNNIEISASAGGGGGNVQTAILSQTPITARPIIRFLEGANVSLSLTDDAASNEAELTIGASANVAQLLLWHRVISSSTELVQTDTWVIHDSFSSPFIDVITLPPSSPSGKIFIITNSRGWVDVVHRFETLATVYAGNTIWFACLGHTYLQIGAYP